tara:strand:+ start:523 stop:861 length:339 start_codon:yes stop_codon:yes gene_type:complete
MANHVVIDKASGYDQNNRSWSVELTSHLVDDGTLDTVIEVDETKTEWTGKHATLGNFKTSCKRVGIERFSSEYAAQWRDPKTGELSAKGLQELGTEAVNNNPDWVLWFDFYR